MTSDTILLVPRWLNGAHLLLSLTLLAAPRLHAALASVPPVTAPEVEYIREPLKGDVIHIRNHAAVRVAEAKLRERVARGLPAVSPYSLMEAPAVPRDPTVVAQEFLAVHAPAFGINGQDLEFLSQTPDQFGMTHVRFRQLYQGVPVYGVDVAAHVGRNNQVTSVHGRPARITGVQTLPLLTQAQAAVTALAYWQAQHEQKVPAPTKDFGLYIALPSVLGLPESANSTPALVWAVDVVPDDCHRLLLASRILVDAETGAIRREIELSEGDQPLNRKVYDCSYYVETGGFCWSNLSTNVNGVPYTFGRREGMPPRGPNPLPAFLGSLDVDNVYDYLGSVDAYYWERFGRDGANNLGGLMVDASMAGETRVQVHLDAAPGYGGYSSGCGAFFNKPTGYLLFCRFWAYADVLAHEYSHAVVFYSHPPSGMSEVAESRSLNEGQADFFGEMLELYRDGRTDWLHDPTQPNGYRNIADPPGPFAPNCNPIGDVFWPDHWTSRSVDDWFYENRYSNNCFAYQASGIVEKGCYLVSEGGNFNGCTIPGLGAVRAAQVVYRAATSHYASNEDFNMAYWSLFEAASEILPPSDADMVKCAFEAVEIDQVPAGALWDLGLAVVPQGVDVIGW